MAERQLPRRTIRGRRQHWFGHFTGAVPLLPCVLGPAACGEGDPAPPTAPRELIAIEIRGAPEEPLPIGETVRLTAWGILSAPGPEVALNPVWASSNSNVATVDASGLVTARTEGEARISATSAGVSGETRLLVEPAGLYELLGRVVNQNRRPVEGVQIVVVEGDPTGLSTFSRPDGSFFLSGLLGEVTVAARKTGYAEQRNSVADGSAVLDFILEFESPLLTRFGSGQWLVGDEITPGRYFADPEEGCLWQRRSRLGASAPAGFAPTTDPDTGLIAEGRASFDSPQEIVDIAPTDIAFRSSPECGAWSPEPVHEGGSEVIQPGTWLVGRQVTPGAYRTDAREFCYWARLGGFGGTATEIIEDDFVEHAGAQEITILPSDAGFRTDDECGPWTRPPGKGDR